MKYFIILSILLSGSNLFGQTDSIEKSVIYNQLVAGKIEQEEFSKIWLKWNQTMKELKHYPDLPLDKSGKVHYLFLNAFGAANKEKLFNHTLEWLAINYGLIPSYIYSDPEDGKIVFRNSLNLKKDISCTCTTVISIKDEKIMVEYISIAYQTYYEGHYKGDIWVPETTGNSDISQIYPIVLKKPADWNENLDLLKLTNELFNTETKNLCDYISTYDSIYIF
jgi:hypothetical protein